MSSRKIFSTSVLCTFGIILFLMALAVMPGLFRKRSYSLTLSAEGSIAGKDFPLDVALPVLKGPGKSGKVTLRSLLPNKESRLLVNFWATWCPPCVEEFPTLEYLNRELKQEKGKRVPVLVTISVDEKAQDVLSFLQNATFHPTVTVFHDPTGEFSRRVGTNKFPETYLIDGSGKILYKWVGPENWLSASVISRLHQLAQQPSR